MKNKKWIVIGGLIFIFTMIIGIILYFKYSNYKEEQNRQRQVYQVAKDNFEKLYSDNKKEIPVENITVSDVEKVEKKIKKVVYPDQKEEMLSKLKILKKYISIRDTISSYFDGDILKSSTTIEMIEDTTSEYKELPNNYQELLSNKIDLMLPQYTNIQNANKVVLSLFTDSTMTSVRTDINRDNYNNAVVVVNNVIQQDVASHLQNQLNIVNTEITNREEAERRRLAEIERKRREQEIAAAWHILNVPYISQNRSNVLNGCEVASLLMGLQYKGYLKGMTLAEYAEGIPKSSDPFSGFTYSIFELEPTSVPHWVAPGPLALYGRTSSGANVIDSTGASLDELDNEIAAGNPVVIYLTSKFNNPKPFIEGAPKNIHVLLLTGYNHITKEQIITDPWTHDDGRTKWYLSKSKVERIYNSTGKRSVIIK